jgi:hypothetical protein
MPSQEVRRGGLFDDYVDYVVAVQIPGVSEERLFAFIVVALTELELRFKVALRV